ncbi:hypothetical protein KIPB_016250, partial [Kipferlia bialata]
LPCSSTLRQAVFTDGSLLIYNIGPRIIVHNVLTHERVELPSGHSGTVRLLYCSPGGDYVFSACAERLVMWSLLTFSRVALLLLPNISNVCCNEGANTVCVCHDTSVSVYSLSSLDHKPRRVFCGDMTPGGARILNDP